MTPIAQQLEGKTAPMPNQWTVTTTPLTKYTYVDTTYGLENELSEQALRPKLVIQDYSSWDKGRLIKELNRLRHSRFSIENQLNEAKMEKLESIPFAERRYTDPTWFTRTVRLSKRIEEVMIRIEMALGIENNYIKFFNLAKKELSPELFEKLEELSRKNARI